MPSRRPRRIQRRRRRRVHQLACRPSSNFTCETCRRHQSAFCARRAIWRRTTRCAGCGRGSSRTSRMTWSGPLPPRACRCRATPLPHSLPQPCPTALPHSPAPQPCPTALAHSPCPTPHALLWTLALLCTLPLHPPSAPSFRTFALHPRFAPSPCTLLLPASTSWLTPNPDPNPNRSRCASTRVAGLPSTPQPRHGSPCCRLGSGLQ